MLKYSVLYYKRTNKVHKNKGVTREDGILTIAPPLPLATMPFATTCRRRFKSCLRFDNILKLSKELTFEILKRQNVLI